MSEETKKLEADKAKKTKKLDIQIKGIDIDKNEYQEIVMSNSARPENSFYER